MEEILRLWPSVERNLVLVLGAILFAGALFGRVVELFRLPRLTGYIVAGLILGPHGVGLVDDTLVEPLHVLATVALATIAFNIGGEFNHQKLRRTAGAIVALTAAQLIASFVLVLSLMLAIGINRPYAFLLAALATTTAPTTTYLMISSLAARGRAVDLIYGVLALNDASAILIFGLASSAAAGLLIAPGTGIGAWEGVLSALGNEMLSIAYGVGGGLAIAAALRIMRHDPRSDDARLKVSFLGLALAFVGVAQTLGLSHLLAPLALGVVMANTLPRATMEQLKHLLDPFTDPLFLVFLVLAGSHLRVDVLGDPLTTLIAVCYVAARLAGKYLGIAGAASVLGFPKRIVSNLGLCFATQGGLAIGMLLTFVNTPALAALPADRDLSLRHIVSAALIAVLISQLFGPAIIRVGLTRSLSVRPRA